MSIPLSSDSGKSTRFAPQVKLRLVEKQKTSEIDSL